MEGIIARLCGRLFGSRWMWRFDLINYCNRRWRGGVLFVKWNDVRGRLLMMSMSGGTGTTRSGFCSGNTSGLWFFIINRALVVLAYIVVADDFF